MTRRDGMSGGVSLAWRLCECGHERRTLGRADILFRRMSPELTSAAPQLLTDQDLYLFNEGSNYRIHEKMGAHLVTHNGVAGCVFSVWAPNARSLSVVGSFNGWNAKSHQLSPRGSSGIWEGFIPGVT